MNPNLKWKVIFILAVVVLCLYSIFGLPTFPTSFGQLKDNFTRQIKLGLDLQGGTHLILQVQVQEAVSQETDQVLDNITKQFRDKTIRYDELRKLGDTQILVHNIATETAGAARNIISDQFPDWDESPAPGEPSGYILTMKPSHIADIQ